MLAEDDDNYLSSPCQAVFYKTFGQSLRYLAIYVLPVYLKQLNCSKVQQPLFYRCWIGIL